MSAAQLQARGLGCSPAPSGAGTSAAALPDGRYSPRPYPGAVALIRAQEQPARYREPTVGWEELVTGRLETRFVPGSDMTYLRRHFQEFAAEAKACVEQVRGG